MGKGETVSSCQEEIGGKALRAGRTGRQGRAAEPRKKCWQRKLLGGRRRRRQAGTCASGSQHFECGTARCQALERQHGRPIGSAKSTAIPQGPRHEQVLVICIAIDWATRRYRLPLLWPCPSWALLLGYPLVSVSARLSAPCGSRIPGPLTVSHTVLPWTFIALHLCPPSCKLPT